MNITEIGSVTAGRVGAVSNLQNRDSDFVIYLLHLRAKRYQDVNFKVNTALFTYNQSDILRCIKTERTKIHI